MHIAISKRRELYKKSKETERMERIYILKQMCETKSKVEQTALTSINGVGAEKRWNLGDVWIVLFLVCFVLGCDCESCECKRGCKTSI